MRAAPYSLAIETSAHGGSLALGRGDALLAHVALPEPRRHNLALMPGIADLMAQAGASPDALGSIYLTLGPGSFTGLRIAVATAQMLALIDPQRRVIGIPTLSLLQAQHPEALICLNIKRESAWSAGPHLPPALRSLTELRALQAQGLTVVADDWPGAEPVRPQAEPLWHLGQAAEARGEYTDPTTLAPLYIREPEAVTLWDQREQARC